VLRILGRSWTFCDVHKATAISRENVRQFFHVFVKWGGTKLYDEFVKYPTMAEEASVQSADYAMAGFHGCIGSTDATHVSCEKMPIGISNQHRSYKLPYPARTYNLTCDHCRRILYTTRGHPARYNDKSLIRLDKFALGLKGGSILDDRVFDLKYRKPGGAIGTRKFRGAWLLVDNGYLDWSVTIPPQTNCIVAQLTFAQMQFILTCCVVLLERALVCINRQNVDWMATFRFLGALMRRFAHAHFHTTRSRSKVVCIE
jgi:hypothetical protein